MKKMIGLALVVGFLMFLGSTILLDSMQRQNGDAALVQSCIDLEQSVRDNISLENQADIMKLSFGCDPAGGMEPIPFVRIPALLHYPILNGIAAAIVAFVIGLLVMIANSGRPQAVTATTPEPAPRMHAAYVNGQIQPPPTPAPDSHSSWPPPVSQQGPQAQPSQASQPAPRAQPAQVATSRDSHLARRLGIAEKPSGG